MLCLFVMMQMPCSLADDLHDTQRDDRRVAAEILVILGDARKFHSSKNLTVSQKKGLADRIRGGLASLVILIRIADANNQLIDMQNQKNIRQLAQSFGVNNLVEFIARLETTSKRYPLMALPMVKDEKTARGLHETYCAACHDDPVTDVERPAFNLFEQARQQTGQEFLARLIVGVRGDRTIGLRNPFTLKELAALSNFYKNTVSN